MEGIDSAVEEGLARNRAVQRAIEGRIDALATSLDGRTFTFHTPADDPPRVGGYVTLDAAAGPVVGLVLDGRLERRTGPAVGAPVGAAAGALGESSVTLRYCGGEGVVLDASNGFHDAPLRSSTPDEVAAHLAAQQAGRALLEVGALASVTDVAARIDAAGFGRHTFLCGQSGSGKTYSLGVLLERLLLDTSLPIVILDPNSDYVRLPHVRSGTEDVLGERWVAIADRILVRRHGAEGQERLRLRIGELTPATRAAMLRLDPIADRDEYSIYLDAISRHAPEHGTRIEDLLGDDRRPEVRALLLRATNLGADGWELWARDRPGPTVLEELDGRDFRALCVDLGTMPTPEERAVAATAVLERLWDTRAERRPVLVVIDEAHNVCPQHPDDPVTARATEIAVRIAAEGRKYGIFLLVSTQRPHKVHEQVLSQCDNLICMRMNSARDAAGIADTLSFAPAPLLARTPSFGQGEALVAGKLVPHPLLVRFGARITEEGGSDVPSDWARIA